MGRFFRHGACVLVVTAALAPACSSPPPASQADEYSAELFPNTRVLDATTLQALDATDADGTLHFTGTPAQLSDVAPGRVLLAGVSPATPHGMLRFVYGVSQAASGLTVKTVSVPVEFAFKKLHVKAAPRTLPDIAGPTAAWSKNEPQPLDVSPSLKPQTTGGAHASDSVDLVLFDADDDPATTDDQVTLHGDLGGGYTYSFGVDVDWGNVLDLPGEVATCLENLITGQSCAIKDLLPEVKAGFSATADAEAHLKLLGVSYEGYQGDYTVASVAIDPPIIVIGPLVFVIGLDVLAHAELGASSDFVLESSATFNANTDLEWSSKTGGNYTPPQEQHTFEAPNVQATIKAHSEISVGPKLSLLLYDLAGPYASFNAYASLDADLTQAPCFHVHGGANMELGLELGIELPPPLGFVDFGSYSTKANLFDADLLDGDCQQPPVGANQLPPGAGPDSSHLLNPTFVPWSQTFAGAAFGFFLDSQDPLEWSSVTLTIDGRFVVAGSDVEALTKLDTDGHVVWSNVYTDPQFLDPSTHQSAPVTLQMERVAPTLDGAMLVLAYPFELVKVGQHGGVYWAERFDVPRPSWGGPYGAGFHANDFAAVAADGSGGFLVAGSYQGSGAPHVSAWLLRVAADGSVVWSKTYALPGLDVHPTSIVTMADGSFVVSGYDWDGKITNHGLVARVDTAGSVVWSNEYRCPDATSDVLEPAASILASDGSIVLAGRLGAVEKGVVLSVGPDGAPSWVSVPWSGSPTTSMGFNAIAELPTSGFVVAGEYWPLSPAQQEVLLAGLDVRGYPSWMRTYEVSDPGAPALPSASFPGLRITDDGGILMSAYTSAPSTGKGSLWTLKAFARDGTVAFEPGAATSSTPTSALATCTVSASPIAPVVTDLPPNVTSSSLVVAPSSATSVWQTP